MKAVNGFLDEYDVLQQCLYLYRSMLLSHLCTRKPESWTSVSGGSGENGFRESFLFIRVKDIERGASAYTEKQAGQAAEKLDWTGGKCIEDGLFSHFKLLLERVFKLEMSSGKKKNL